jgi:DNA-binding SARP family transcriptional activator/TolB-like protein
MLHLRTLGQLAVVSAGEPPGTAASQRKPLALLAFLAVAGERGASRDRILAALWPDTDEARGRSALRQTLYALRRDLRAPELFVEGTALGLNPAVISTDLDDLQRAAARRDWAELVRLYQGPFLDGFYLPDSAEFERWVETERRRLAGSYLQALERLALEASAAGDQRSGAAWLRRILAEDPLNGRVAAQLMEALVATGEAGSALEVARTHETTLREELGTGPDPYVTGAAARIVNRMPAAPMAPHAPAGPASSPPITDTAGDAPPPVPNPAPKSSRPRPTRLALGAMAAGGMASAALVLTIGLRSATADRTESEQRVVAVTAFRDVSPALHDRYFGTGVPEGLVRQLGTVPGMKALGPAASAGYGEGPDRPMRLAANLGVDAVVDGTVRVEDGRVRIAARVTEAATARTLLSRTYSGRSSDLLTVQSELARDIIAAMGLSINEAQTQRMTRVPTTSAEAYRLFLRSSALSDVNRIENIAGIDLLERAVRLDSGFAFAYATLARRFVFHAFLVDPAYGDSTSATVGQALAIEPDLALAHKALGDLQGFRNQPSAARLTYLKALELDPYQADAMADLSDADATLGRFDESLYWAARAFRMAPRDGSVAFHIGVPLYFLHDDAATERWLAAAERRWPEEPRFPISLARLDYSRGNDSGALRRLRDCLARHAGDQEVARALAGFSALIGTAAAESLLTAQLRQSPEAIGYGPATESPRALLAMVYRRKGDLSGARALEDSALVRAQAMRSGDREPSAYALELASLYAVRGQADSALDWLEVARVAGELDYPFLARDPFFASLHREPRWQRSLRQMEADVASMRQRAAAVLHSLPSLR